MYSWNVIVSSLWPFDLTESNTFLLQFDQRHFRTHKQKKKKSEEKPNHSTSCKRTRSYYWWVIVFFLRPFSIKHTRSTPQKHVSVHTSTTFLNLPVWDQMLTFLFFVFHRISRRTYSCNLCTIFVRSVNLFDMMMMMENLWVSFCFQCKVTEQKHKGVFLDV